LEEGKEEQDNMNIIEEYKKVSMCGSGNIIRRYPVAFYPQLTADDYNLGYIIRYFVKLKSNKDSSIIEVDEGGYKFLSENIGVGRSFYQSISLRWKITGKREDVIIGNTKTVESRELLMSGISLKLGNRLQFWKDL